MKREIEALLHRYAQDKRRQADAIEKFARALSQVAEADDAFQRHLRELAALTSTPTRTTSSLEGLFKSLDELSSADLEAMTRARP